MVFEDLKRGLQEIIDRRNENGEAAMMGQEQILEPQRADRKNLNDVGGIDLNPANLNLHIKRDGNGIALPIEFQDVSNINVNGFTPVIINIQPVSNLPLLLGANINLEEKSVDRIQ